MSHLLLRTRTHKSPFFCSMDRPIRILIIQINKKLFQNICQMNINIQLNRNQNVYP